MLTNHGCSFTDTVTAESRVLPRSIIQVGLLLALVLVLAACDKEQVSEVVSQAEEAGIVLSSDGVGPLNGSSSFNMHQMTVAFNDFSVEEVINFQNKVPYPVIRISKQGHTIMTINPDAARQSIFSIVIEDNSIKNSLGHPLGMSFSDVYTYGQQPKCQPGTEELSGRVLCYAPGHPNVLYVFNGRWDGADGQMPPREVLQSWVIESIIWRPKSTS